MRRADTVFQPAQTSSEAAVAHGVGRGLQDLFGAPMQEALPERLRDLVALLVARDAVGRREEGRRGPAGEPTQLVLVVEDDPAVRDLAVTLLRDTVLDVAACGSGEEAVALLKQRGTEVAMVFTDVRLPGGMDGIALARAVSQLWPGVRVVVTSGFADARIAGLPQGAVYMPKPWRALDVLAQVDHAVRHPDPPVA
ncbi:response regulator [Methylobacterium sp. WSM2598]|uniref:response regulator n=1 Tax=Methylobacterium sp. WSM2598 TaxID=398261 RepID=UPI001F209F89|nr:response regulator [Methylobacterium sp. WSM2598]